MALAKRRLDHPGQARLTATIGVRVSLLIVMVVSMCACVRGQAPDLVTAEATLPEPLMTQDRLPAIEATNITPEAQEDGRVRCEGQRQMICNQPWVGADEKCRRMRCELIAGFWLLRDPQYVKPVAVK